MLFHRNSMSLYRLRGPGDPPFRSSPNSEKRVDYPYQQIIIQVNYII